jgi:hypothetical protein
MSSPKIYQVANLQSSLSDRVLKAGDTMTGNLNVAATLITQNVIPDANVTYDLGTSTARFKDLWLSNSTIYLGEASISAQGGNVSFGNAEIQLSNVSTKLNVTNDLFVSGNVGIGTTSPSNKLHVVGTVNTTEAIKFSASYLGTGTDYYDSQYLTNRIFNVPTGNGYVFAINNSDKLTLDSSGNLGLGVTPSAWETTSSSTAFQFNGSYLYGYRDVGLYTGNNAYYDGAWKYYASGRASTRYDMASGTFAWNIAPSGTADNAITFTQAMTLDASGNLGIGTTSPAHRLQVETASATGNVVGYFRQGSGAVATILSTTDLVGFGNGATAGETRIYADGESGFVTFRINATERARITSGGDLLVGTTTTGVAGICLATNKNISFLQDTGQSIPVIFRQSNSGDLVLGSGVGWSSTAGGFASSFSSAWARSAINVGYGGIKFYANAEATVTAGTDVAMVERARITSDGNLLVAKNELNIATVGHELRADGITAHTADGQNILYINRLTNDGDLVQFYQATALEGSISVSGATVSYNAFAGSHWSQLQDGSKPDILRGTVMESINELCVWEGEDNERLPKCKISDTAGSKKVYGVFMAWDNDWTETNDMYVTAVGAFICRVNADVAVQEGDLLESNGDGTARVQADDLIRSSTIGKVTSTVKTHEYDDGSYCVPTVLYCG